MKRRVRGSVHGSNMKNASSSLFPPSAAPRAFGRIISRLRAMMVSQYVIWCRFAISANSSTIADVQTCPPSRAPVFPRRGAASVSEGDGGSGRKVGQAARTRLRTLSGLKRLLTRREKSSSRMYALPSNGARPRAGAG